MTASVEDDGSSSLTVVHNNKQSEEQTSGGISNYYVWDINHQLWTPVMQEAHRPRRSESGETGSKKSFVSQIQKNMFMRI